MYWGYDDDRFDDQDRQTKISEGLARIRGWIEVEKLGGRRAIESWLLHLETIIARPRGVYRLPHLIKDHLGIGVQQVLIEDGSIFLIRNKRGSEIEKGLPLAQRELNAIA